MSHFSRFVIPTIVATLLAACSGGESAASNGQGSNATVAETGAQGDLVAKLTGEYLAGDWCHVRNEFPGEGPTEENDSYIFAADGTLKYQNNPSTPVEKAGSWELKDSTLVVKPTLQFLPMTPVSIEQDAMTFKAMGSVNVIWTRGACTG